MAMLEAVSNPAVLVVEDEPLLRLVAADGLLDAGFRVFEAVNGDEAMALLHSRDDISAVFTDVEMPGGLNGLALANAIRERWPAIGIVVTSGRAAPTGGDLPDGVAFMPKPYLPSEIVERIRDLAALTLSPE